METQIGTDATAGLMGINAEAYGAELSLESMEALQERYNQQLAETNAQWQALADESKRWAAETAAQNPDDRYDQQWLADTYAQIDAAAGRTDEPKHGGRYVRIHDLFWKSMV